MYLLFFVPHRVQLSGKEKNKTEKRFALPYRFQFPVRKKNKTESFQRRPEFV